MTNNRNIRAAILLLSFCLFKLAISAQSFPTQQDHDRAVDSLLHVLQKQKNDTAKVNTLNALSGEIVNWSSGEYPKAMEYAQRSLALSHELNFKIGEANAYEIIGSIYINEDSFPKALSCYKASLQLREDAGDKKGVSSAYLALGNFYSDQRPPNHTEAIKNYLAAVKFAKESGDKTAIGDAYQIMGLYYMHATKLTQAYQNYTDALKIYGSIADTERIETCHNQLGIICLWRGDYAEALDHFYIEEKLSGYKESFNIASVYLEMENFPELLKFYNEQLRKAEENGDNRRIAAYQDRIGNVYLKDAARLMQTKGNPDSIENRLRQAADFILRSYKITQGLSEKDDMLWSLYYNGQLYLEQAQFLNLKNVSIDNIAKKMAQAEDTYQAYLKHSRELPDSYSRGFNIAYGTVSIGAVYFEYAKILQYRKVNTQLINYKLSQALEKYAKSLNYWKETENQEEICNCYIQTGKVFALAAETDSSTSKNKLDTAVYFFNKALSMAKDAGYKKTVLEIHNELTPVYKKLIDYKKALENMEAAEMLKDSVESNVTNAKVSELIMGRQNDKAEFENKISLEKTRADQQKRNNWLLMGGSLLLVSSVFASLLARQKRRRKRVVETEKTKRKMAELELQSLRSQLNPHFMFNSLNAIQELILKEDSEHSHLYLSRFSDLLRTLLDNTDQPFIPLEKEIEFLRLYLSLEKLRMPDLNYSFELEESLETKALMIPNMILQPYIENALWHGLSHKKENKKLNIIVLGKDDAIQFRIEDNGVGRQRANELKSQYRKEHKSKGIELLSKRFSLLSKEYGSEIQIEITDKVDGAESLGTVVEIKVPFSLSDKANLYRYDKDNNN